MDQFCGALVDVIPQDEISLECAEEWTLEVFSPKGDLHFQFYLLNLILIRIRFVEESEREERCLGNEINSGKQGSIL